MRCSRLRRNVDIIPGMDNWRYRNGKLQVRGNARRPFRHARRIQKIANSATIHYSLLPVHYLRCRHYEPVTGRWMQRDPIGEVGGLCLYAHMHNATCMIDVLGNGSVQLAELLALSGAITAAVQENPWLKRAGLAGIILSCADCVYQIYLVAQGTPECVKTEFDQGREVAFCICAYKSAVQSCLTAALAGVGTAFGPWWGVGGAFAGTILGRLFDAYVPDSVFNRGCPRPKIDKCCGER